MRSQNEQNPIDITKLENKQVFIQNIKKGLQKLRSQTSTQDPISRVVTAKTPDNPQDRASNSPPEKISQLSQNPKALTPPRKDSIMEELPYANEETLESPPKKQKITSKLESPNKSSVPITSPRKSPAPKSPQKHTQTTLDKLMSPITLFANNSPTGDRRSVFTPVKATPSNALYFVVHFLEKVSPDSATTKKRRRGSKSETPAKVTIPEGFKEIGMTYQQIL